MESRKRSKRWSKSDHSRKKETKRRRTVGKGKEKTTQYSSSEQETETDSYEERGRKRRHIGKKGSKKGPRGPTKETLDASTTDYSDPEPEPDNCFGEIEVNESDTFFRSNTKTLLRELKALPFTESHLKALKSTPFWLLFDAIYKSDATKIKLHTKKFEEDIRQVMYTYNSTLNCFVVAGEELRISCGDVQLILGVCGGTEIVPLKVEKSDKPEWILRLFAEDMEGSTTPYVMYKHVLYGKLQTVIEETSELSYQDVARLTICYLMAALLAPNRNAAMSLHLSCCMQNLEDLHRYDWCTYIADMLMNQIQTTQNMKTGGCSLLLPFWLCEHTSLVKPIDDMAFPRFLRWDLRELNRKLSKINLCELKSRYLRRLTLKPTTIEKDALRYMLEYWENAKQLLDELHTDIREAESDFGKRAGVEKGTKDEDNCTALGSDDGDRAEDCYQQSGFKEPSSMNFESSKEGSCKVNNTFRNTIVCTGGPSFSLGVSQELPTENELANCSSDCGVVSDGQVPLVENPFVKKLGEENRALMMKLDALQVLVLQRTEEFDMFKKIMISREDEHLRELKLKEEELEKLRGPSATGEPDLSLCEYPPDTQFFEDPDILNSISTIEAEHYANVPNVGGMDGQIVEFEHDKDSGLGRNGRADCLVGQDVVLDADHIISEVVQAVSLASEDGDVKANVTETGNVPSETSEVPTDQVGSVEEAVDTINECNESKTDTLEERNEFKTPCGKISTVQPVIKQSSLVMRIKSRTANDEGRPKEISPCPSTNELLDVVSDEEHDEERENTITFKLDESCIAVQKCTGAAKAFVRNCLEQRKEVWKGSGLSAMVTPEDVMAILNHKCLSGWVIDSWGEFLLNKYGDEEDGNRAVLFTSDCWGIITSSIKRKSKSSTTSVDKSLEHVKASSLMLFPLLTEGEGKDTRESGNHWTLLMMDLRSCKWRLYNSRAPRTAGSKDVHLTRSSVVVDYVEARLRERFSREMPSHNLLKHGTKYAVQSACPKQDPGSVDYGVVVCQNLEYLLQGKKLKNAEFNQKAAGGYRAQMVEMFTCPWNAVQ